MENVWDSKIGVVKCNGNSFCPQNLQERKGIEARCIMHRNRWILQRLVLNLALF